MLLGRLVLGVCGLALLSTVNGKMEAKCPQRYVYRPGTRDCFLFHDRGRRTWWEAREYCRREAATLPVINSKEMTAWLSLQIVASGLVGDSSNFWIDAIFNATLNKWYWDSSGADVNLDFIAADGAKDGDCGTITTDSTLLGHPGSWEYHFICQRPIDEPEFCDPENDWRYTNEKCYTSPDSKASWTDAVILCNQLGGYLTTINSYEEDMLVRDWAGEYHDNVWIGMSELSHPKVWYWVGDNSSTYINWNANESMPLSQGGYGAVVVDHNDGEGRWMTEAATNSHHYVCEKAKGACVQGWENHLDSCYYFNALETDKVTWDSANEYCTNVTAKLVIIETLDEDDYIRTRFGEEDLMWIGLYSKPSDQLFYWVDGRTYSHDNFTQMTLEDEAAALAAADRKCVYTQIINLNTAEETMNWAPQECPEPYKYICEVPAGQPVHMLIPPVDQYCPEGWVLESGFCYYLSYEEASWSSAEDACKKNGGHLASVVTWMEQDFIRSLVQSRTWIGLSDRQIDGTFVWSDGNRLTIQNWNGGEPSGGNENCVEMLSEQGAWNDQQCSDVLSFVCKRPYSSTPLAPLTTTTEAPESLACGHDWTEDTRSGICYRLVEEELIWDDARLRCQEMSYDDGQSRPDLVSLSTPQEQIFVQGMLSKAQLEFSGLFIGLRNSYAEGLTWVDGSPVTFFNFQDGEPNDPEWEQCGEIFNDGGTYPWNDLTCTYRRAFICEKKGLNYVAPTVPSPAGDSCPNDWTLFNQHCYYVSAVQDLATWTNAVARCQKMYGSVLSSVLSEDENTFIMNSGATQDNPNNLWLGLHVASPNQPFVWEDGSPFEYTNWAPGQPDNLGGEEYCGEMILDNQEENHGKWQDSICDQERRFTCKMTYKTCPQSWKYWNDKCYYISDNYQTWNISLERCKQVDGEASLLSLHSKEEVDHVLGFIDESVWLTWIGLYHTSPEEPWQWADGSVVDYPDWRPGQPDKNDTEFCALLQSVPESDVAGFVDNYPCSDSHNYACQFTPTHRMGCEYGWEEYNGYCYYNSAQHNQGEMLSFDDASNRCGDLGGDLASVSSSTENAFLASTIPEYDTQEFWIGLSDSSASGLMKWKDGSNLIYSHLAVDLGFNSQPMCFVTKVDDGGKFYWYMRECEQQHSYFCKKGATITPIGPSTSGCANDGDLYYEGSCYTIIRDLGNFNQGKDNCSLNVPGSHLVTIKDQLENAFLSAYYDKIGEQSWIGLQAVQNADGSTEFHWVDGSDFTFSNWGQFQPMTGWGSCVFASGAVDSDGLWYVGDCSQFYPYICEYDRVGYTTQVPPTTTLGPAFCAPGWSYNRVTSSCYKLMMGPGQTQDMAEKVCNQYAGHLVSITSEAEEQFILGMPDFATFNYTTFWTGLKLVEGGGYTWTDGSPTDFLHWANGQPDSYLDREDCVTAYKVTLQISDNACDGFYAYMCKAPQGMPASTPPPITNSPDVPCPGLDGEDGWLLYNDHCYKVFVGSMESHRDWRDARKSCQGHGGELASVLTSEENSFIISKVHTQSDDNLWVGAYADYEKGFHWSDGEPFDFVNWNYGEPNNMNDQESCVELFTDAHAYWNDQNCGMENGWICKKPSGSTLPPPATTQAPEGHCPGGWVLAGSKCLKVYTERMTFGEARSFCKSSGVNADLASLHGPQQQAVVTAVIGVTGNSAWIGMTRNGNKFYWVDQTDVDYTNWNAGEPNDNGEVEDCVEVQSHDGTWNDGDCIWNNTFFCMQNIVGGLETPSPHVMCDLPYETFFAYMGSCYKAIQDPKTWQAAEDYCVEQSAHLVSITGLFESSFVYALASDLRLDRTWTGFNSLKSPDQYSWSDNYPVLYSNWGNDQPNVTDTTSRCVQLSTSDAGLWFSKPCDEAKPFFCKHSEETMPTPEPPVDGSCPTLSWLDFGGGYCYYVEGHDTRTWNEANQMCLQLGGNLLSIHSQAEMDLIIKSARNIDANLWTGLIQQVNDYGWSDGSAFNFFFWDDNEPSSEDEPCVEMFKDSRKWNDKDCSATRGYVCKAAKVGGGGPVTTAPTTPAPLTTSPSGHTKGGLSGGGIAGIVISCLALVTMLGLVGYSQRHRLPAELPWPRGRNHGSSSSGADSASRAVSIVDIDGSANFGTSHTKA